MVDQPTSVSRRGPSAVPILVTGFAALLALVALTQPLWAIQVATTGGTVDKTMYGWTARVGEEWRNGVLVTSTTTPYSSPDFVEFRIRDVAATTYVVAAAYALSLLALGALQFGLHRGSVSRPAVLGVHLLVCVIGLAALVYAAVAIPPAAAVYTGPMVTGFWGQAPLGGDTVSWGPGTAWWLGVASTALALIAFAIPIAGPRNVAARAQL
jgi:hypothetical protein